MKRPPFYGQWTQKLQTFMYGYMFIVILRYWYFIAKIGVRNCYFSAIFICF